MVHKYIKESIPVYSLIMFIGRGLLTMVLHN